MHSQAFGREHDISRSDGEALTRKGRSLDRQDNRGQAVPASDHCDGKQGSKDHLGDAHEETGIPAACVLTAPTAQEMQDVEVMMRN